MWNINPDSWDYRHGYNEGVKKTLESINKYQTQYLPKDYLNLVQKNEETKKSYRLLYCSPFNHSYSYFEWLVSLVDFLIFLSDYCFNIYDKHFKEKK